MDDFIITESGSKDISSLKSFLQSQFQTKDLGMLKYFLGIEVMRSKLGIFLSQREYVLYLLSETGKLGVKPCSSPMVLEGKTFQNPERYKRLVRKLNYLTITRSDIACSVSVVSQYMFALTVDHWATVEHILSYLKRAPRRGILYSNHGQNIIGCFSNADRA